jgi:hypothetical protein
MCSENLHDDDDGSMWLESRIGDDCDGNEKSIGMFCTLLNGSGTCEILATCNGVVSRGRASGSSLLRLEHGAHEGPRGMELGGGGMPFIVSSLSRLGVDS